MTTVICSACGTAIPTGQRFCGHCGTALPGSAAPVLPMTAPVPIEEERRLVTVLFCDLAEYTPLSESLDPEDLREIQTAYFSAMSGQIDRYGGTVEKYAGDAVLALFGAPVAHEDDAERAVLCGLAMQSAITSVSAVAGARWHVELTLRVGVNTGEVVSGAWDAGGRQDVSVTGDAINTAARLQGAAALGGVLVGEVTMRLARRRIRFGDEQRVVLKGKNNPVAAYAALGVHIQPRQRWQVIEVAQDGYATPLVGRERDLSTLLDAWERARAGEGQLLELVGEPGVGKSRLLAEALQRIEEPVDIRVLRGHCLSYGQSVSLWLIADLIRSLCSVNEETGPEQAGERISITVTDILSQSDATDRAIARDVLGEVLGLPPGESLIARADPRIRRQSLIRILGLMITALARTKPLVIVLEDLHWLDSASGKILDSILTTVRRLPLLMLTTARPEGEGLSWLPREKTSRLLLTPLSDADASVLARAVLGGNPLSADLESHLLERAGGNPFYLEELLRFLQESGGLTEGEREVKLAPGIGDGVPTSLAELLLARLDRLEQQAKGIAQVGSVIGTSFAVRLLGRVLDREEAVLASPLQALQEAAITMARDNGELEHVFRHVLIRDAAYGMLVRRRQRELHLAVGRGIAALYPTDEYVELIAYHLALTREDAEAAGWLERAGDRASATYAIDAAMEHYMGALARLEQKGDALRVAGVQVKLGAMLHRSARYAESQEVQERALPAYEAAGELESAGAAIAQLGQTLLAQGKLDHAQRRVEAIATLLDGRGPSVAAADLQSVLGDAYQFQGKYGAMLDAAERLGELADAIGDSQRRGKAEERRGTALNYLGRIDEARAALERAIPLLEETGALRDLGAAEGNLGENRRLAGDLSAALTHNERSLQLARRTGDRGAETFLHLNLAQILLASGEWARARLHLERVEEIAATRDIVAAALPFFPCVQGELAMREGNWEIAREHLSRAVDLSRGANQEILEQAQTLLAELTILEGKPAEAREVILGLMATGNADLALTLPSLAWAELELGETARALETSARAEKEARARHALLFLPDVLRVRGMTLARMGRCEEARTVLTEGKERARTMPNPYAEARILVGLGLLDRQEQKEEHGRVRLEEAVALFRLLGASKDVQAWERELSIGNPSPHSGLDLVPPAR